MTNKDKAIRFCMYMSMNDKRCDLLIALLSAATGLSDAECIIRINRLADGK